jgi:hypothetical protein
MKPVYPNEFSKFRLLMPLFFPFVIILIGVAAQLAGHQWNIHGSAAGLFGMLILFTLLGLPVLISAVPHALRVLYNHPSCRTFANIAVALIAALFLGAVLFSIVAIIFKMISS